ncbi:hypothetical protein ACWEKT_40530 [Nocardia takedensis]|uniref:hypothetical protein n=1 Tax=Nocardia takedensis TaxID=259390 RepID=UPI00030282AB|nr:hypothetical protein [Nocardia takedensis]
MRKTRRDDARSGSTWMNRVFAGRDVIVNNTYHDRADSTHPEGENPNRSTADSSTTRAHEVLAKALAYSVRRELQGESRRWRMDFPPLLEVRWHAADAHLMAQRTQVPVEDDPMLHNGQFHQIAETYRRIGSGRLVVMGKIGSGKSSLVRYLALEILGPENGETVPERVPVVLNIASWNPRKVKFEKWMATIINRDHPRIRIEDVLLLFRAGRILPILDGLDEFQLPSHRATALGMLNADSSMPVILAGRRDEYAAAVAMKSPLLRAWAIDLEPLTTGDIRDYLPAAAHVPDKAALWELVIDELENNPDTEVVGSVLDSPLMVALAHMVYGSAAAHQDPRELVRTKWTSRQELESRLFDSLLDVAFPEHVDDTALGYDDEERPRRGYEHESATRWLRYLAAHAVDGELQWWSLGAATMKRGWQALVFALIAALMGAAVGYAIGGRATVLNVAPPFGGIALGALLCAAAGAAYAYVFTTERPVQIDLYSAAGRRNTVYEMFKAPIYGLTAAGVGYLLVSHTEPALGRWSWLLLILAGLFAGVPSSLIQAIFKQPNRKPLVTEIAIASGGAALSCLVFAVVAIVLNRPVGWWGWWLLAGLVYGILLVFVYGPRTPIDSYEPAMPARMIDNSRTDFLYYGITNAVTYAVTTVFVTGLSWVGILGALVYGLVVGIAVGVTNNAWGRWALLMRLDWQQKLPRPLLPFLEEAHRRRLLRQSGAVYRFWHEALERYLRELPDNPPRPDVDR